MKRNTQKNIQAVSKVVLTLIVILTTVFAVADTQMYFIHNDHLGTPQVVTDESQTVVWEGNKKPFGETEEITATIVQQTRFPGQYFDEESELYYNYYRDYDPSLGRYIQSDPIGTTYDFSDPRLQLAIQHSIPVNTSVGSYGLNHLYGYVDQNPLNYIDPFGLQTTVDTYCARNPAACMDIGGGSAGRSGASAAANAAVGAAVASASTSQQCEVDKEKTCDEQLNRDTASCRAIQRAEAKGKRPKGAASRCYASAMQRYGNCLAGRPEGPLDTWNN